MFKFLERLLSPSRTPDHELTDEEFLTAATEEIPAPAPVREQVLLDRLAIIEQWQTSDATRIKLLEEGLVTEHDLLRNVMADHSLALDAHAADIDAHKHAINKLTVDIDRHERAVDILTALIALRRATTRKRKSTK